MVAPPDRLETVTRLREALDSAARELLSLGEDASDIRQAIADITQDPPDTSDSPRFEPEAWGLKGQLSALVDAANRSGKPVSTATFEDRKTGFLAAIAVIRGKAAVDSYVDWKHDLGFVNPESGRLMHRALDGAPASKNPAASLWLSPPIVCPCEDPQCVDRCVEIGCRHHPGAGMRLFRYANGLSARCSVCNRLIAVTPKSTPLSDCANCA